MDDKRLLELAARAAGLSGAIYQDYKGEQFFSAAPPRNYAEFTIFDEPPWNPLASDADAFRLAVKLGLNVSVGYADSGVGGEYFFEAEGDRFTATRRAIVRAAAAIGEGMC